MALRTVFWRKTAYVVVPIVLGYPVRRQLLAGVTVGLGRWRASPKLTGACVTASTVYGQGIFWTIGQDFIGVAMKPKWRPGLGHRLSPKIAAKLPPTAQMAWTLKAIEILSDASKMPIEGRLYRELGIIPDGVAALVTQPLWSWIEVVEKVVGLINYPERVHDTSQIEDSISSIYGTWTRNLASWLLFRYGSAWIRPIAAHFGS